MIELRHLLAGWVLTNLLGKLTVSGSSVEVGCGLAQKKLVSPAGAAPVWRQHFPYLSTFPVIHIASLYGVACSTLGLVAVCAIQRPGILFYFHCCALTKNTG